jgi:hypothetical protein
MLSAAAKKLDPRNHAGKPKGYRAHEVEAARAEAGAKAKEIIDTVADKLNIEDDKAKASLEFAISVVKDATVNVKDRIAAARLTLDFTQPKPASRTELEIKKAEDFLDALAETDDTEAAGN